MVRANSVVAYGCRRVVVVGVWLAVMMAVLWGRGCLGDVGVAPWDAAVCVLPVLLLLLWRRCWLVIDAV